MQDAGAAAVHPSVAALSRKELDALLADAPDAEERAEHGQYFDAVVDALPEVRALHASYEACAARHAAAAGTHAV